MTSVSAGHIILTPTQPVGGGRPQRESNPGHFHQESRALPTGLPRPHPVTPYPKNFFCRQYKLHHSFTNRVKPYIYQRLFLFVLMEFFLAI